MTRIPDSSEIRHLSNAELTDTAAIIRQRLVNTVARQGGHLASNLGVVELTLALHAEFDLAGEDALYFDVGHQCYVHKLLTGREKSFEHLREAGGCSGFPVPEESTAANAVIGSSPVTITSARTKDSPLFRIFFISNNLPDFPWNGL